MAASCVGRYPKQLSSRSRQKAGAAGLKNLGNFQKQKQEADWRRTRQDPVEKQNEEQMLQRIRNLRNKGRKKLNSYRKVGLSKSAKGIKSD